MSKVIILFLAIAGAAAKDDWDKTCSLDSRTIYPYAVKIWHRLREKTLGHGVILSYFSVLTTCSNYIVEHYDPSETPNDYEIIGQKVMEAEPVQKVCWQSVGVQTFVRHPKCFLPTEHIFDFGLFILKDPFNVEGSPSYPAIPIKNDPYNLMQDIMFLDHSSMTKTARCEMALFYFEKKKTPMTFNTKWQVLPIPFDEQCRKLFCEYNPPIPVLTAACEVRYGLRMTASRLCMKCDKIPVIDGDVEYGKSKLLWYAGGPLVCNGTVYGLISFVKWRHDFPKDRQDFFYVTTLLRAFGWIVQNRIRYGANWIHPYFVTLSAKDKQPYTTPSRKPRPSATLFPPRKQRILQFIHQNIDKDLNWKDKYLLYSQKEQHKSSADKILPGGIRVLYLTICCSSFTLFDNF